MSGVREKFDRWADSKGFDSLESFAIWDYMQGVRAAALDEAAARLEEMRTTPPVAVAPVKYTLRCAIDEVLALKEGR